MTKKPFHRRRTDSVIGALVKSGAATWDFIDRRQIDKHIVTWFIIVGTVNLTLWAKDFASLFFTTGKSGADIALIIGAVTAPWSLVQAAALAFYFRARA